ncbi:MAG: hypothetical protein Q9213_004035 [Squamulea squamosa]
MSERSTTRSPSTDSETPVLQRKCHKVAVLLLCWANKTDENDNYRDQVLQLRSTFEDGFRFQTTTAYLDTETNLQIQLLSKFSEFAADHDGPGSLLIIYYAGFAAPGELAYKPEFRPLYGRDDMVWDKCNQRRSIRTIIQAPSLTPALICALGALAEDTADGTITTTVDFFAKISESLGADFTMTHELRLENARYTPDLEEQIVLQPLPAPRAPE